MSTPGLTTSLLRPLRRLPRRVLLHRRPLAALAAGGAVLATLQVTSPAPPQTVTVWTASRDLPGGAVLRRTDLAGAEFAPGTAPGDAIASPHDVVGRTLAAPLSRGEPLTSRRTVSEDLLDGYPGTSAVPLRITDAAMVDLLRVGDRVSLVAADPDGRRAPEMLLESVPVVALPSDGREALSSGVPGRVVVVAVPRDQAIEVAETAASSILVPLWSG